MAAAVRRRTWRGSPPPSIWPDVAYLLPGAPGNSWYPQSFMAPFAANEPWLSRSLANQARLIEGVIAAGVPPERIVLGGFSQGACLTAETLVRAPRRYGAGIIFTGGLIGPPGTAWPAEPALAGTPVYLSGSEIDPHVPPIAGAGDRARAEGERCGRRNAHLRRPSACGDARRRSARRGPASAPSSMHRERAEGHLWLSQQRHARL